MKHKLIFVATLGVILILSYSYYYRHTLSSLPPKKYPDISTNTNKKASKNDLLKENFDSKVWAHQINTIEDLKEVECVYNGFEIDVFFKVKEDCFDVHHPSEPSINLTLETLIDALENPKNHYYWLDFKNLDSSSCTPALTHLQKLLTDFSIHKQVIVESPNPKHLSHFTEAGIYTSYYIPSFLPNRRSDEEIKDYAEEINQNLERYPVNAISGYHCQFPFMDNYFSDKDILVWHIYDSNKNLFNMLWRRKLLSNERVKIILESKSK
ncbi:hypothetical protein RCC89_10775 [Cytophagaceae bacterium ABcell3]|nr:hypothetical protein RCC89_10775 [Cytophagaceae bacterium ABcell3]